MQEGYKMARDQLEEQADKQFDKGYEKGGATPWIWQSGSVLRLSVRWVMKRRI